MQLNTTIVSIETGSENNNLSFNKASVTESSTPNLTLSNFNCFQSIDSLLNMIENVNLQLRDQANQLIDIRTELNKIDTELNNQAIDNLSLQRIKRTKVIKKTKCKSAIENVFGSSNNVNCELEVEVRLAGFPKFVIGNSKYKRLVSTSKRVR